MSVLIFTRYPDGLAWQFNIPKKVLRKSPEFKKFHSFLVFETEVSARLPSPAFMVTNLDASNYPSIKLSAASSTNRKEQLLFDRILCDVPCSGDGTLRKNIGIWKHWQPNDGNGLHGLQLRILQRAMKMLKSNGRIVYSTCSINPVENEAVIAAALESNPEYHLVDVSSNLPELKRRPGMSSWRPTADKSISSTYQTYEAFVAADPQAATSTKLTPGHWPPPNAHELKLERWERKRTIENVESSELETKKPRLESEPETSDTIVDPMPGVDVKSVTQEGGGGGTSSGNGSFKEMPYTFLSPRDPALLSCISRLRLTSEFPSSNVLVRNPEGDVVRSMYLTNDLIKQIILANDFTKIRLTAAGTKVFTKQEGGKGVEAQYRILGEGLPVVLPYTDPTSIVNGNMSVLKHLVMSHYPLCTSFEESFRPILNNLGVLQCAYSTHALQLKFSSPQIWDVISSGSPQKNLMVLLYPRLAHDLLVPIWKSGVSISLMVDKKAKNALSLRVFGIEVPPSIRDKKASADGGEVAPAGDFVDLNEKMESEAGAEGEAMILEDVEVNSEIEQIVVQAL
ncbi:hypothetical protein HHX47_DHR5000913 [Lentinula edodes]|nr:hypothetical protein HHX47_DHR5000913 [Lentinula edodes]